MRRDESTFNDLSIPATEPCATFYAIFETDFVQVRIHVKQPAVILSKNVLTLRKFPVEIRKIIYSDVIADSGLTTGLIAAARPDSLLYGEVLETLFKEHVFVLSVGNQKTFSSLSNKPVKCPENADLVNQVRKAITQRVPKFYLKGTEGLLTSDVSMYFPIRTRITDITMEFQGRRVNVHQFYDITKLWFKYFSTVVNFTVIWTNVSIQGNKSVFGRAPYPPEALKGAIRVANKWLKVEAVLVEEKGELQMKRQGNTVRSEGRGMSRSRDMAQGSELEIFTWT
ncbi:hypothetical protein G7Y89_g3917 [Cudoniella acicularis]|uniref:Uncharacterized protein n=1 Tax=Cudoniella acicularis TaxID=354080 RepID=A0A8H4RRS7_9HELO|nr:hypothetical protein G7Y89_g3917 [Cudoniella acicularis]